MRYNGSVSGSVAICGLIAALVSGCSQGGDTIESKKAADRAERSSSPDARVKSQVLPMLTRSHDDLTWPRDRDKTPEELWKGIVPYAGKTSLDEDSVRLHVAMINVCAWSMTAKQQILRGSKTTESVAGLRAVGEAIPGMASYTSAMADGVALSSTEKADEFIKANGCNDEFP